MKHGKCSRCSHTLGQKQFKRISNRHTHPKCVLIVCGVCEKIQRTSAPIDLNSLFPTYPHRCVSHSLVLATFTRSALSQLFFFALHHSMPRSDPIIFNSFPSIRTNVSSFDRFFAEVNTVFVLHIFNFCSLFNLLLFFPCFCT